MNNQAALEIIIKAKDETSEAMKNVKKNVEDLNSKMKDSSKETESMTASFIKAEAILKGAEMAFDFMKESVTAYIEASKETDQTNAIFQRMGLDIQKTSEIVGEFSDKLVKAGFDDEMTAKSVAKLTQSTGDLQKGMQLTKLAADLTTSGIGSLEDNVDNLQKIMIGKGERALVQYKLNLKDNATTLEILNAIQAKVTQTTDDYAQTAAGRIAGLTMTYSNLKEEVGGAFVSALTSSTKAAGVADQSLEMLKNTGTALSVVVYEIVKGLFALTNAVKTLAFGAATLLEELIGGVAQIGNKIGLVGDETAAELKKMSAVDFEKMKKSAADATFNFKEMMNPIENIQKGVNSIKMSNLEQGVKGIANAQKTAKEATDKYGESVKKLNETFTKLKDDSVMNIAEITADFVRSNNDIQKSIDGTRKSIDDLNRSFAQQNASDLSSVADTVVSTEKKIADLKKQLSTETTDEKKLEIQNQINAEQKGLDSVKGFTDTHQAEIAESRRVAALTDVERALDTYNKKRALAVQEYNEKLSDLQNTLIAEQTKQVQELAIANEKIAKISSMEAMATETYKALSAERTKTTITEVNTAIEYYNRLAQAIASYKSAQSMAVMSTISSTSYGAAAAVTKRASGGDAYSGRPYLVGENGPELFMPNSTGRVIPNNQLGGGITLNITGNSFLGDDDVADKIGSAIMRQLQFQLKF